MVTFSNQECHIQLSFITYTLTVREKNQQHQYLAIWFLNLFPMSSTPHAHGSLRSLQITATSLADCDYPTCPGQINCQGLGAPSLPGSNPPSWNSPPSGEPPGATSGRAADGEHRRPALHMVNVVTMLSPVHRVTLQTVHILIVLYLNYKKNQTPVSSFSIKRKRRQKTKRT